MKAPTYTRKRRINLPLYSLARQNHMYVKVTGEMRQEHMPGFARSENGMVDLLPVIDLETGEEGLLIVLTVLKSTLERVDDGYVGKSFELLNSGQHEGKDYTTVEVYELEDTNDGQLPLDV